MTVGGPGYGAGPWGGVPWGGAEQGPVEEFFETLTLTEFLLVSATSDARFYATGQSLTKVQLTFDQDMLVDAAFTNPASYTVQDLFGNFHPVVAAFAIGAPPVRRVALIVSLPFDPGSYYVATVVGALTTMTGQGVYPPTDLFLFPETYAFSPTNVNIPQFTGEYQGGLLNPHAGLVFFSPALETAASNSVIQVEELSVCTKAYDTYTFPSPPDPTPLYTWGPNLPVSNLGLGNAVCWAGDFRLVEARMDLSDSQADTVAPPVDSRCIATLTQPWDLTYVALLNNTDWHLYDGVPTSFFCANNLGPIPPGPTVSITLQP